MSNVWKRPLIGPDLSLVEVAASMEPLDNDGNQNQFLLDNNLQEKPYQSILASVLGDNLLAATKLKAAALERAAHQKADDIIKIANQKSTTIKEKAKAMGYRVGYEAGYDEGQKKSDQLHQEAVELMEQAQSKYSQTMEEIRPQVLELALSLAERILRQELAFSPYSAIQLLKDAADKLPTGVAVSVQIAPGTSSLWEDAQDVMQEALGNRSFTILENPHVPKGEFLLSSEMGNVDARIKPQLDVFRTEFIGERDVGHGQTKSN